MSDLVGETVAGASLVLAEDDPGGAVTAPMEMHPHALPKPSRMPSVWGRTGTRFCVSTELAGGSLRRAGGRANGG